MKNKFFILILFSLFFGHVFGQVNYPKGYSQKTANNSIQEQNRIARERMGYKPTAIPPSNPADAHKFILNQAKEHNARKENSKQQVYTVLNELKKEGKYKEIFVLPSSKNIASTKHYETAFEDLKDMNNETYSIKNANFLVENSFFENKLDYMKFEKQIREAKDFLLLKMKELGYNPKNNLAKNLILLQLFSDTLQIKNTGKEHYPIKYNFDDYLSENDWSNMFVSNILKTNIGQCHSLPLLYLILADEIGAKAHLSFSPNHFYIKFKEKNKWYNVELTSGIITTDAFILQSGYIKAEALQNKIYMNALNDSQLLSQNMVDLAQGYINKYGYDSFVEKVIKEALKLYPKNINANLVYSNYLTANFQYVQKRLNLTPKNIRAFPEAILLLRRMQNQYQVVDNLGYSEMPVEAYDKWLKSLDKAKNKQDTKNVILKFNQNLK